MSWRRKLERKADGNPPPRILRIIWAAVVIPVTIALVVYVLFMDSSQNPRPILKVTVAVFASVVFLATYLWARNPFRKWIDVLVRFLTGG
jgi:high-affinity Fe2+/Pb2+ permease